VFAEKEYFVAVSAPGSFDGERLDFVGGVARCHHPAQNPHPPGQLSALNYMRLCQISQNKLSNLEKKRQKVLSSSFLAKLKLLLASA